MSQGDADQPTPPITPGPTPGQITPEPVGNPNPVSDVVQQIFGDAIARQELLQQQSLDTMRELSARTFQRMELATQNALLRHGVPSLHYIYRAAQLDIDWFNRIHEEAIDIMRNHGLLPPAPDDNETDSQPDPG
jgi:hypothetical protein